ncbi:unnamed protein product, partial [Mesorhabditis spiculigera]
MSEAEIIDIPTAEHWKQWKQLITAEGWCGFDDTMLTLFPISENVKMVVAVDSTDKSFLGSIVWAENDDLICIDTYYVKASSRGRGVGRKMWKRMKERLDLKKPMMLKAEDNMKAKYMSEEFPCLGPAQTCVEPRKEQLLEAARRLQSATIEKSEELRYVSVQKLNGIDLEAFYHFDRKATGRQRRKLLDALFKLPCVTGGVLLNELGKVELGVLVEFDSTALYSQQYKNPTNLGLLYVNHDNFMHFDL